MSKVQAVHQVVRLQHERLQNQKIKNQTMVETLVSVMGLKRLRMAMDTKQNVRVMFAIVKE